MNEGIKLKIQPMSLSTFRDEFDIPNDNHQYHEYKKYLEVNSSQHCYGRLGNGWGTTIYEWFSNQLIQELVKPAPTSDDWCSAHGELELTEWYLDKYLPTLGLDVDVMVMNSHVKILQKAQEVINRQIIKMEALDED